MSDEQQRPGDAARGGSDPDETRQFDASAVDENQPDGRPRSSDADATDHTEQMPRTAFADDDENAPAPRPDATAMMPAADRSPGGDATSVIPAAEREPGGDATSVMPAAEQGPGGDATSEMPVERGDGGDETVVAPRRPDATAVMPAAGLDPGPDDAGVGVSPAWTGRAEVRPPQPRPRGEFATRDWDALPPPREPRGRWWMPIVVGIVVLVLLALLGWGVWLILQASAKDDESPAPASTTSVPAPETTEPTSTPTTTPTTSPSTTEPTGPTEVTIPALKGLSSDEARQALARTGLAYRLRFVTSADAAPGTVIDSDPAEGQQVPSDTTVTLIVASAPSSAATTTPGSTGPTDTKG